MEMRSTSSDFRNDHEPIATQRPDNTAFTQQRLPAWQPLLSAGIVLPFFFFAGLSFLGIGIGLYYSSNNIQESEYDYTGAQAGDYCSQCANATGSCRCNITFQIQKFFQGPVFMYYELSNYYQNHYRYGISKDDKQLSGNLYNLKNPANECVHYQWDSAGRPIAPCGAIANSMFNDTFTLYYKVNGSQMEVPLNRKGISWWTDYNVKFRNPINGNKSLSEVFNGTAKPSHWPSPAYNLSDDPYNTGFINEDFMVWMRCAALPNFRKLYRRIESGNFSAGLPPGDYRLDIVYMPADHFLHGEDALLLHSKNSLEHANLNRPDKELNYPVLSFRGRKKVVFSSVSWMGGKNPFLGIAFLVIGSICTLVAMLLLIVFIKYQEKNNDDDL